jgi:hypothetical protein
MSEPKDTPLAVKLEDGDLIIRIGIDRLAFCAERQDDWNPYDEERRDFVQKWRIADKVEFAKDVVNELCREEEDGSTPLNMLLDRVCMAALDDGSTGVEECPPGTPSRHAQDIDEANRKRGATHAD